MHTENLLEALELYLEELHYCISFFRFYGASFKEDSGKRLYLAWLEAVFSLSQFYII